MSSLTIPERPGPVWLPRSLSLIAALLAIGWAVSYALQQEMPVGTVRGQVVLAENGRPLEGADITLEPVRVPNGGKPVKTRYTTSGPEGRFTLRQIPAGDYYAYAASRAHSGSDRYITVDEGGLTQFVLRMDRSEPALKLNQHQRVFGTREKALLAVSGYVDGRQPPGKDALQLRIYKTRLSSVLRDPVTANALDAIGRGYDAAERIPDSLLKPQSGPAPARVKSEAARITEADREGFFYQKLDFGVLPTGLYLVDIAHAKDTVCAYVLVTDTALVLKKTAKQAVTFVADMTFGQPIPNSRVRTYRDGRVVGESVTDARGLAELALPPRSGSDSSTLTTVAFRGDDEAVVWQNEWSNESAGQYAVHAYTDRPLYRPGQRIYFKGIARRKVPLPAATGLRGLNSPGAEAGNPYRAPADVPVSLEIRDPNGERILSQRVATNAYGSFAGFVDLDAEAPTGGYSLLMDIGGDKHTHFITVSSYRKPEFAVTVTPEKKRYTKGETVTMAVSAQYYFGAPVAGAKVKYSLYREPDWSAEYPDDYSYEGGEDRPAYHDYEGDYYGEFLREGETALDENGKATITFPTDSAADPAGPQSHVFSCSVTVVESAEREVYESGEVKVTAGDFRLTVAPEGYVLLPGMASPVVVEAFDYDGNPVRNLPVTLEFGYETWNRETQKYDYRPAGTLTGRTGDAGAATLHITPPKSGSIVLKARATDGRGRAILGRANLWAMGEEGGDIETDYATLSVLTDKRRYNPGDTARVLLNAEETGQTVLLTIEGEKVYRAQIVPMPKRSVIVHVPILAEYGPNIALSACYIKDKKFARSEANLRVITPAREIAVAIAPDKAAQTGANGGLPRYQPRERIAYTVRTTDAQGQPIPAELSFGVVDEAIYALREDDPTALKDAFYPRRYNQVETIYSFAVIYLGDADKAEPKIEARKKFPDTAYWNPFLRTNEEGMATVSFTLPDNLTTWRATATAHTLDTRLGRATNKILSSKDFLARLEMPRFLTQRDQSRLLALVHNETDARQTAQVRLRATNLAVQGDLTRALTLEPRSVGEVSWNVTAEGIGEAQLRLTAWTTGGAAQLTDGVEMSLPIRAHGREQIAAVAGELTAAQPETEIVRLDPGAILSESRLTLRVTPSVASALSGGLDYLIGYPYGCTEQTMSRFLPDLLVQRVIRAKGWPAFPQAAELPQMVRSGLLRLYKLQNAETGGWGWWEHDKSDPWMTAYVLYGLGAAQAQGVPVSKNALARARDAAKKLLPDSTSENKAFLLYALAQAGFADLARAERKGVNLSKLGPEGMAYLILLDRQIGQPSQAVIREWERRLRSADGMLHWKADGQFDRSDLTATAAGLRAMLALNPQDARIGPILRWLMWQRTGAYWRSTRDTAFVLAALCDYLESRPGESPGSAVAIRLNGKPLRTIALTPDMQREPEIVIRVPGVQLRPDKNEIVLERIGGASPVFYSVERKQVVPSEDMAAVANEQLTVQREYLRVLPKRAGSDSWTLQTEPTGNRMKQGDRLRVRLTIEAKRDMAYVLIEDPFPSGCEVTERGDADEIVEWGYWWSSTDVRDDRIAFFARSLPKGKHVIEYNLRAQTPGTYHTLPTLVQPMYAPEIRAESAETRVEVR